MNSFIPWTGGKKNLREAAVLRFPLKYERYIEVFGGGGWVLFHKPQTSFEVLNDVNSNLTNLYRCVREQPEERRTAAGEMFPLHFVQAATSVLIVNFVLNSERMRRPLRRSRIGRQIASTGSVPAD